MAIARILSPSATSSVATASVAEYPGVTNNRGWALNLLLPLSNACMPVRLPSAQTPPMIADSCSAGSSSSGTPTATITALDRLKMALQSWVIAASGPQAATASLSRVISSNSLAAAVAGGATVKVLHRPMIDADGVAICRAPVSTKVTVTP
ncbi:hypothetical protein D3C81_766280 [compost metagenome]